MLVFYTDNKKVTKHISNNKAIKKEPISLAAIDSCNTSCASNCIKPKSKCCNKYKKKGINCKRCPLNFPVKIAS